jgi:hypothetical protein
MKDLPRNRGIGCHASLMPVRDAMRDGRRVRPRPHIDESRNAGIVVFELGRRLQRTDERHAQLHVTVRHCRCRGGCGASSDPAAATPSWHLESVDAGRQLNGVSCAGSSLCVAVDDAGDALTTLDPGAAEPEWHRSTIDAGRALTAIACPSASFCVAIDDAGAVLTSVNPSSTSPRWQQASIDPGKALRAISCPSSRFCLVADDNSDILSRASPARVRGRRHR